MTEVEDAKSSWFKKGATLSDKSARKEFGLTQEEIIKGIEDGKLHYHVNSVFGNPYLKLIRSEVEAFVDEKHGSSYLKKKKIKKELAHINKELKMLRTQVASMELRKSALLSSLEEFENKDQGVLKMES